MILQNQIRRTLSSPEAVEQINTLLATNNSINRTSLASTLCEQFGFYDPNGKKQISCCMKVLYDLEKQARIVLPPALTNPGSKNLLGLECSVDEPTNIPDNADDIDLLELVIVESEQQRRIWNKLMESEHPKRSGRLFGRQIRYLVRSEHGWLGALGFNSSVYQVRVRDEWIGWNDDQRLTIQHYLINMSRFLIRPMVSCNNLASRVLEMAIERLANDFEASYGYKPLMVEAYMDEAQSDICHDSASWEWVGHTKGSHIQEKGSDPSDKTRDIFICALEKDFRRQLGISGNGFSEIEALEVASGLDGDVWAENEFGGAALGDQRISRRLVDIAEIQGNHPGVSFSQAVDGDWKQVKGYYRLIDSADESAVTVENMLAPHRQRTIRRMKDHPVVLCIQDGSDLNYASLSKCEGLGVIGRNQTSSQTRGLHMHSMIAVTPEGLPLGVLSSDIRAPEVKSESEKRSLRHIPIEQRKTFRWIEGVRDSADIQKQMPNTQVINVMDREADFFELFDDHRNNSENVELIVRARHDRKTDENEGMFESVRQTEVRERLEIEVPRQSARPKLRGQKEKPSKSHRSATVSIRFKEVNIYPPNTCKNKDRISITIIHLLEENPPADTEAIEWYLLTTMTLSSPEDAVSVVGYYVKRWRIEDWHRVVKSGCRVEDAAHRTVDRLKRVIGLNLVIAWRIMLMTLLGREVPELPAEILFSNLEIKVLSLYAEKKKLDAPMNLGNAVLLVAKMGGYIGRGNDLPPGYEIMWKGFNKLKTMREAFELLPEYNDTS